jgi:hypothetical protein
MAVSSVLQLKLANPILSNSPETAASSSNYAVDITRMADKATSSDVVAQLGQALAGLTAKLSDTALMNNGANALVDRMAEKTTDPEVAARLGQELVRLAIAAPLDLRDPMAKQALAAHLSLRTWQVGGEGLQRYVEVFSRASVKNLLVALASPMGAAGEGREALLAAIRLKLKLKEGEDYWSVVEVLRKTEAGLFSGVSD